MIVKFISHKWPVFWFGALAVSLWGKYVLIRKDMYSNMGELRKRLLMMHESVHITRKRTCRFWTLKYLLLPSFRFREELEAYGKQILYEFRDNMYITREEALERYSIRLSSKAYMYSYSKEYAREELDKWMRLNNC